MAKKINNIINQVEKSLIISLGLASVILFSASAVFAVDGSGSNLVSPVSTTAGSTGGTYTFTFTAAETMNSGGIQISVPFGFSAPQGTAGVAGYTTASSASGMIADVKNNMDSATGWAANGACTNGITADSTTKHEGANSVRCANANESSGNTWYYNLSSTENWSSYTTVGFWIYSTASINNNRLQFSYDNNSNLSSPIARINIGSVSANTWVYKTLTLSGTRTTINSYGFRINHNSAVDNADVYIDDILLGPGRPTFSGNDIGVRFLTLTSPQTVAVTYGSGGGASGVTAPSASGVYVATTTARISDNGTLTNIASHPTITVNNPVPVLTSISPTSTLAGGSDFVLTATGSNFVPSSVIRWNGVDLATNYISALSLTATVPAVNITSVGTSSLTVFNPTPGGGTSASQTFTIIDPAATSFSISSESASMGAGTRLKITATRLNITNSPTTFGNNTVYLYTTGATSTSRFYDAVSGGNQITSANINSGTSTVVFWYYDEIPGSRTLTASDNASSPDGGAGITDGTTSVTVNVGATTQFTLSDASTFAAGDRIAYTVTRKDQVGNLVSSGLTNAYLYTSASSTGKFYDAESGGSQITSLSILDGSTSTNFWYYDELAGNKTVTVSDNSTAPDGATGIADASDSVAVSAGTTAQFILSGPNSMYAKTRSGFTVLRKDVFGNSVSSATTTVYLYTNSGSGNAKFYNDSLTGSQITSIDISNGQAVGSFWYYDDVPASTTVTVSDNASSPDGSVGIIDSSHQISILPVATKFVISGASSGTVDASVPITIQAQKPDGSVDENYQSDVTLSTTGSATGGGLVDIINGVGTKNISNTIAETINLSLSDTETTGLDITSTHQIVFSAGALAQFTLNDVVSAGAGVRAEYTITRKDQYGNLISSGSPTTAYLYSNSSSSSEKFYDTATAGNIITSIQILAGQSSVNFWYYDDTLGNWTITASDNSTTPDGNTGIADALDSIAILPGPTASFEVDSPGNMTAGTRLGYTVSRKDEFGNSVTSGSQTVYLYSTSLSTSTAFYSVATGGSPETFVVIPDGSSNINFWYTDGVAGTYTLTMSDSGSTPDGAVGIIDVTRGVTVLPVPITATRFVILDPGSSATVDAPVTVTVQAQDDSGNIDTANTQSVTLNATGSATGGGLITLMNGVGTKNISDIVAETINLTLTDTAGTGLNVSFNRSLTFAPGAVAQLSLSEPGEMAAGTRQEYSVIRKDQFGNHAVSGLTKVYLYTASESVNAKFYESESGGSAITFVDIIENSTSSNFWYYDEKSATTTVTVSDNSTASDGLAGIADDSSYQRVIPGNVDKFTINNPGNMFASTRLGYTVSRKDTYDNLVTSGANIAYLYSNSSGSSKKFYDSASGGLIVSLAVIDDGKSSANFWYYDEEPGTWVITVSDNISSPDGNSGVKDGAQNVTVSLVPIVATKLVLQAPTTGTVGSPVTISVQAEDNNGNVDTTFSGQITINVSGSGTGGGVVSIVNGVGVSSVTGTAEGSVNLSLVDSGSTGLDVSSVATIVFSTTPTLQPGFTGGGGASMLVPVPVIGGVTLAGRAYPGAKLNVLAIGEDTTIVRQSSVASSLGNFEVTFRGVGEGEKAYGLLVQDKDGRSSQAKTFDINLVNKSNTIRVLDILVSPTIGFTRATVTKGDRLTVVGYASPGANIEFELDGKAIIERGLADATGFYRVQLRTGDLDIGSHNIKARQVGVLGKTSDYSPQKVFTVSNLLVPQVDFNNDSKVDVRDWSIFLARWNSKDPNVKILNDLNGDSKVDVSDFSIFAKTLRR